MCFVNPSFVLQEIHKSMFRQAFFCHTVEKEMISNSYLKTCWGSFAFFERHCRLVEINRRLPNYIEIFFVKVLNGQDSLNVG